MIPYLIAVCNLFPSTCIESNSSARVLKLSKSLPINFGAISFSITGIKSLARNRGSLPPAPEYWTAAQSPKATCPSSSINWTDIDSPDCLIVSNPGVTVSPK